MALRNASTAASTTPKFEDPEMGNDTDVAVEDDTPTPAAAVVAPAPVKSLSLTGSVVTVMKSLQWAIPAEDLEGMAFGVFPRITVGLDGFSYNKDRELGKRIKVGVHSWNPLYMVVTGESDPEANKLIRTSFDGVTLKDGTNSVQGYIDYLRSEGYGKASKKQYMEMYGNLIEYQDSKGNIVVVPDDEQEIVQLSFSPQSVGQFQAYLLNTSLRARAGIQDSNVLVITQTRKVIGSMKFGIATFGSK